MLGSKVIRLIIVNNQCNRIVILGLTCFFKTKNKEVPLIRLTKTNEMKYIFQNLLFYFDCIFFFLYCFWLEALDGLELQNKLV